MPVWRLITFGRISSGVTPQADWVAADGNKAVSRNFYFES